MKQYGREGFTLAELLIIVTLLVIAVVFAISFINPKKQLERSWDMKRKADFSSFRKILEEYYNDKEAYPDDIICDGESQQQSDSVCYCHVCGLKKSGISSYFNTAYCDPQHPERAYLYEYDCSTDKPQWFQLCGTLSFPQGSVEEINKPNAINSAYNFGVASLNKTFSYCVEGCPSDADSGKYCKKEGICNICGTFAECILNNVCDNPVVLYSQPGCDASSQCSSLLE